MRFAGSVLDRLGQVFDLDLFMAGEVGDGAGDFNELVVAAAGESEFFFGLGEQVITIGR